jgi:hypothetical protein
MSEYDLGVIHDLLTAAFTPPELRRFCNERSTFRPVVSQFPADASLNDMADTLIGYCERMVLLDELLDQVRQFNPRQYDRFKDHKEPGHRSPRGRLPGWLKSPVFWEALGAIVGILALLIATVDLLWLHVVFPGEPRIIHGPTAAKNILETGEQTQITVGATGDSLTYVWTADNGAVEPAGPTARSTITYTAPDFVGTDVIRVEVRDKRGKAVSAETTINVVQDVTTPH